MGLPRSFAASRDTRQWLTSSADFLFCRLNGTPHRSSLEASDTSGSSSESVMLRLFLELAFLIIVIAWVLAEALAALGRWSDEHPNSELALDIEMDPAE